MYLMVLFNVFYILFLFFQGDAMEAGDPGHAYGAQGRRRSIAAV